ncbi:MAG: hypothetical protein JRI90_16630 [Deltaproteobacteria bacterium]|nr:hypothetical protein [Deltaproteobacteria bacterium]
MGSMRTIVKFAITTLKGGVQDRLLQGLILVGLFLIVSTSVFSSFSMRQTLEVAVNYSLSVIHILAIVLTLFFGLNLISKELESKENYKFAGFLLNITAVILILGLFSAVPLLLIAAGEKGHALAWLKIASALAGILFSCSILGAVILLFTSVATSGILPFLMSCAVYAIGENTQPVKRYIASGMAGEKLPQSFKILMDVVYYVFPNFSLFDYKIYAIYNLSLPGTLVLVSAAYGAAYTALCLFFAVILFERRDMT